MALNKVEICGVNTAKLPMLTQEEKDALFIKIKAGDQAARETFIKGNLRLVLSVIKRFGASNENADDLFQIGCIGLIKSIDNFDPSLMVKFCSTDDRWGDPKIPAGQQCHACQPFASGYRLQSDLCPRGVYEKESARTDDQRDRLRNRNCKRRNRLRHGCHPDAGQLI